MAQKVCGVKWNDDRQVAFRDLSMFSILIVSVIGFIKKVAACLVSGSHQCAFNKKGQVIWSSPSETATQQL